MSSSFEVLEVPVSSPATSSSSSAVAQTAPVRRWWLIASSSLLVLIYLAELAAGVPDNPVRLCAFGANSFPLVKNGELFRLATANVLHSSLEQALFSAWLLTTFGVILEPLIGRCRFLTILLVSALAGAAGMAFLSHQILAAGASTGIAGLAGAYAVILWRRRGQKDRHTYVLLWAWFLLQAPIDILGHAMGFLAGLALMLPALRVADLAALPNLHRNRYRFAAALLVAVFLAAEGLAIQHAADATHLADASLLLRAPSASPTMLNALAQGVATSPAASRADLTVALQGIERAMKKEPGTIAFRDTRAAVLYRLTRWQEAFQMEYDLAAAQRTPLHLSLLARFEWALARVNGPLFLGPPPAVVPRARLAPDGAILVEVGDPHVLSGRDFHLVLANGETVSALLELKTGAFERSGTLHYELPKDLSVPKPDTVALTLVDTRILEGPRNETRWLLQPIVPEAARLP